MHILVKCLRRLLHYVGQTRQLQSVQPSDIQRSVNPSMLRWTFALNQWRSNVPHNTLQKRMGLSDPGWLDVREVLAHLAQQPV